MNAKIQLAYGIDHSASLPCCVVARENERITIQSDGQDVDQVVYKKKVHTYRNKDDAAP